MQMSDVIADMLTRIRNANDAKHATVDIPASNMKKAIADFFRVPVDVPESHMPNPDAHDTDHCLRLPSLVLSLSDISNDAFLPAASS